MLLASALYLAAAMITLALTQLPSQRRETGGAPRTKALTLFAESARYVKNEPVVLVLILLGGIPFLLVFPFIHGLMPVYASEVFGMGPAGLGLMMSAIGVGAVVGTIILASMGNVRNKGRVLLLALTLQIAAMVLFSRSPTVAPAIPVLMVLAGAMSVYFHVGIAMIQEVVPDNLRGRVSSLSLMAFGVLPLGSLLAGGLAQVLSAPSATLISGTALAVLLVALSPRFMSVWNFTNSPAPDAVSA